MQFDLTQTHFELFGLSVSFAVDETALLETYQQLQKQYHPDRFADQDEQTQRQAVQVASQVNTAYQTLKAPLARAVYMLELNGVDVNSETDTQMEPAFLMMQMEWRETLDETDDMDVLDALSDQAMSARKAHVARLGEELGQAQWQVARNTIRELQFIEKMQSEIALKEEVLDDL